MLDEDFIVVVFEGIVFEEEALTELEVLVSSLLLVLSAVVVVVLVVSFLIAFFGAVGSFLYVLGVMGITLDSMLWAASDKTG